MAESGSSQLFAAIKTLRKPEMPLASGSTSPVWNLGFTTDMSLADLAVSRGKLGRGFEQKQCKATAQNIAAVCM